MIPIINFVNPDEKILLKINFYTDERNKFDFLVSSIPHCSASILLIHNSSLNMIQSFREFKFIPFIVYGTDSFLEKSFALGAVDYLKEPWSIDELQIRSLRHLSNDTIAFQNSKIFFSNSFISLGETKIQFSVYEYKILSMLNNKKGEVLSRENINYRLLIKNSKSRSVDVHINSIRSKINLLTKNKHSGKNLIKAVRGTGYTLVSPINCG